jgi:hypothetical protein
MPLCSSSTAAKACKLKKNLRGFALTRIPSFWVLYYKPLWLALILPEFLGTNQIPIARFPVNARGMGVERQYLSDVSRPINPSMGDSSSTACVRQLSK